MTWPTKMLVAYGNLLEGTLPKVVRQSCETLLLSGVAGRSGGSIWGLQRATGLCESGNFLLEFRLRVLEEEYARTEKAPQETATPQN